MTDYDFRYKSRGTVKHIFPVDISRTALCGLSLMWYENEDAWLRDPEILLDLPVCKKCGIVRNPTPRPLLVRDDHRE